MITLKDSNRNTHYRLFLWNY